MEDDQQFCLRWNNHQSTLIQNFDTLLESGTLVDCTLAAEGKYLKAHKVVLSACSPYFEGLLSEHYDKHPVFILKDVKFKELKAMMDYMYRGEVNISQDQLAALLKAAESLQIKGLSESKTGGSSKMMDTRQQKVVPQTTTTAADIPHMSSGLTIEKNKVPRQVMAHGPVGDLPEDTASPQLSKGLSSREGSQSPTSRKRKKFRRRSIGDESSIENHDASNSNDMPSQIGVPALGIAPVADEKSHADPTDSIGRSALMTQLTKPADEMLQLPLEKPEPNDNLIEPKSEYLEDPEESVEDLTLDDDMNDLNEMEQDTNRAGPSHDPSQHPAGMGAWHVAGDRSNSGVVGSVAGAPGTTDEVFLAAQEAAQAHRDSQGLFVDLIRGDDYKRKYNCIYCGKGFTLSGHLRSHQKSFCYCNPRSTCHQSQKTRPFSCDQCGTRYAKQSHLIFHVRHDCGRTQRCTACGKTFLHSSSLRKHRQRPPCNLQETFIDVRRTDTTRSATSMIAMNSKKNEGGDGVSISKHGASTSKDVASTSKDVASTSKDVASTSKAGASTSKDGTTPKDGACTSKPGASTSKDCGSSAVSPEWQNYKDTSRYKPTFLCHHCNATYSTKHHLGRHVQNNCLKNPESRCNTEKAIRPFVCMVCGRRFKVQKALTYHLRHECRTHATCPICHKTMTGPVVTEKHLNLCRRKNGTSSGRTRLKSPELITRQILSESDDIIDITLSDDE